MLSIEGNFGRTLPTGSVSQRKHYDDWSWWSRLAARGPPAWALPRLIVILITASLGRR